MTAGMAAGQKRAPADGLPTRTSHDVRTDRRFVYDCVVVPIALDVPISDGWFETYVIQIFVPDLNSSDVVIMGKLSSHKRATVKAKIEAAVATLRLFPPYSPDFYQTKRAPPNTRPYCATLRNAVFAACGTRHNALILVSWRWDSDADRRTDGTKRTRFTEEQIIGGLKETGTGAKAADLARRRGPGSDDLQLEVEVGLVVSEARRLRVLESERAKLKRLLADGMLDQAALT